MTWNRPLSYQEMEQASQYLQRLRYTGRASADGLDWTFDSPRWTNGLEYDEGPLNAKTKFFNYPSDKLKEFL